MPVVIVVINLADDLQEHPRAKEDGRLEQAAGHMATALSPLHHTDDEVEGEGEGHAETALHLTMEKETPQLFPLLKLLMIKLNRVKIFAPSPTWENLPPPPPPLLASEKPISAQFLQGEEEGDFPNLDMTSFQELQHWTQTSDRIIIYIVA